jgi:hypothetical protein
VHGIHEEEIFYYVIVWFMACAAALARIARDREYVSVWHCLGVGATSGFYGFGVVALFFIPNPSSADSNWYWIGISALVGLLGKEQDAIGKALLSRVFAVAKLLQEGNKEK